MSRPVIAGVDGSPESLAAADWAAREARRRGVPLHLVHAWQWEPVDVPPSLPGPDTVRHWAENGLRETGAALARRYPEIVITTDQVTDTPETALAAAATDGEMLVLGSRGLSGLAGFLVGSVGQSTIARAERPVVLVRAGESATDEHMPDADGQPSTTTAHRDVVLGLDLAAPCDPLLDFAFDAAGRRGATLRVVHTWSYPPVFAYAPGAINPTINAELEAAEMRALTDTLKPWREKYPDVTVTEHVITARAAQHLAHSARDAGLLVVGRRIRKQAVGAHIGSVTHAVLHHARCPVAVVAHH